MSSHLAAVALAGLVVVAGAGARSAQDLTRAGLLRAAKTLIPRNSFLLSGFASRPRAATTALEHVYLYRYDNKEWVKASGLLHARG